MSTVRRTLQVTGYYLREAAWSLVRGWRTSVLSLATIVAAVFVLGAVLLASANIQRALDRWSQAAELSVYLDAHITAAQRADVERATKTSPLVASLQYVSADDAARRFSREFPDLAGVATSLGGPVLPASFEVQLHAAEGGEVAAGALADGLRRMPGVTDVRYDRGLIDRVGRLVGIGRSIALVAAGVLALAAALAILSVVRLSYVSRRDEVEILTLVGAPFGAIRGPFVAEGWLQGTAGGLVALTLLGMGFLVVRARYGAAFAEAAGLERLEFLAPWTALFIVIVAGALGALAGAAAVERRIAEMT
jgi:cell division transport system permease protein